MIKYSLGQDGAEILKGLGLDTDRLENCCEKSFSAGEYIQRQTESVDYILIVLQGTAKVCTNARNGKRLLYRYYSAGDILGDIELSYSAAAPSFIVAHSDFRGVYIPFENNREYMKGNIVFMNCLARCLAEKLVSSVDDHTSIALYSGEERLCQYILRNEQNGLFTRSLSETAQSIGVSYRHVFRIINALCAEGLLEKGSKGFSIGDIEALQNKIGG